MRRPRAATPRSCRCPTIAGRFEIWTRRTGHSSTPSGSSVPPTSSSAMSSESAVCPARSSHQPLAETTKGNLGDMVFAVEQTAQEKHFLALLLCLVVVLALGRLVAVVFRAIKQPAVIGEVVCGLEL